MKVITSQALLNGKYAAVGVGQEKGALGTAILAGLAYALHTGANPKVSQSLYAAPTTGLTRSSQSVTERHR